MKVAKLMELPPGVVTTTLTAPAAWAGLVTVMEPLP